jgi:aminoglycoside 3-N-acetyltransferase
VLLPWGWHDDNTTIHLAEALAGVRYRRRKSVLFRQNGQALRCAYAEIDPCCQNFHLVDGWLEASRYGATKQFFSILLVLT